ncbi:MAG TPA: ATP-binding protein [bacterium]|nr:ATP-binding protein [bacterium]HQL63875.1 ATP-binding protein [bacterium]
MAVPSRRRLLITAPLAIILPAGLITYLGLSGINLLQQAVEPYLNADLQSYTQSLDDFLSMELMKLETEFDTAMRLWINARLKEPTGIQFDSRIEFEMPLPFTKLLFFRLGDGPFLFYCRETLPEKDAGIGRSPVFKSTTWKRCDPPSDSLVNDLREQLEKIEPGATLHAGAFFKVSTLDETKERYHGTCTYYRPDEKQETILCAGYIYDLDNYVIQNVLQPVLYDMWQRHYTVASYPLEIRDGDRVIAKSGEFASEETDAQGLVLRDTFPFWEVRYLKNAGIRRSLNIDDFRNIWIPQTICAAAIMILAIIGSIRNIARELNLAKMRSDFVARVSHELRTPLGLIRLFAETLEMERIGDQERRSQYLHTITRESERLSKIIDNVLNFSKIEAGQKQYQLNWGSVKDIVESVVDSMQFHISRNNLELSVEIEPDLPMVRIDREAMAQALWNLLSNAAKYSGDGRLVQVRVFRNNGEVVVSVRDEGIGIAPQNLKRICEKFYRVNDPRVQEQGGSGLGLSVVKHIIEGHNGRLDIQSTLGKGSVFSLCLPIPDGAPALTGQNEEREQVR